MMETAIKVGAEINKTTVENISGLFNEIFESAHKNGMEQKTVRCAIESISRMISMDNLTIQNCVVNGDKTVNMDESESE